MESKELKDYTFDELVEINSQKALSELLISGGKGLRSAIYSSMEIALRWKQEKND